MIYIFNIYNITYIYTTHTHYRAVWWCIVHRSVGWPTYWLLSDLIQFH